MNKGFSLVELIVVIAIMAILVGVAVPVYTNYISEANEAVDEQYKASLESALNTAWVDVQAGLNGNTDLEVTDDITVEVTGNTVVVKVGNDDHSSDGLVTVFKKLIDLDSTNETKYTFNKAAAASTFKAQ